MIRKCSCKNLVLDKTLAYQGARPHRKTADGHWQCEICGRRKPPVQKKQKQN